MAESRIIYALITKKTKLLVGQNDYTGTICKGDLKNIGPEASAANKSGEYIILYSILIQII